MGITLRKRKTSLREASDHLAGAMAGMSKFIDDEDEKELVCDLLRLVGEDPSREGLRETPKRFLEAMRFYCSGYGKKPADVLKVFKDGAEHYDQMVVQLNIPVHSLCEHHLAPFFGVAHIGYLPNKSVVGLSKLSRLVDVFARRLQIQERLTSQIGAALWEHLKPLGVGVVLECRHMCYDQDTEILTSNGFKNFAEVVGTAALVAQYNPVSGAISFVQPSAWVATKHSGQMLYWKSKSSELLVTPEHRCLVASEWKFANGQDYSFVAASDLRGRVCFPRAGYYSGNDRRFIDFAGKQIDEEDYCKFMGMFLSEGCSYRDGKYSWRTTIVQHESSKGFSEFKNLIERLPFPFNEYSLSASPGCWQFCSSNHQLAQLLRECGVGAKNKRIPTRVLHGSLPNRLQFLKFYEMGDGHWHKESVSREITTASHGMVADLQMLLSTCGMASRATKRSSGDHWDVRIHMVNGDQPLTYGGIRADQRSNVDYSGMVYCATVPCGALVVRRNGAVTISGNCMECRGVQKENVPTITSALYGRIKTKPAARAEFLALVHAK